MFFKGGNTGSAFQWETISIHQGHWYDEESGFEYRPFGNSTGHRNYVGYSGVYEGLY